MINNLQSPYKEIKSDTGKTVYSCNKCQEIAPTLDRMAEHWRKHLFDSQQQVYDSMAALEKSLDRMEKSLDRTLFIIKIVDVILTLIFTAGWLAAMASGLLHIFNPGNIWWSVLISAGYGGLYGSYMYYTWGKPHHDKQAKKREEELKKRIYDEGSEVSPFSRNYRHDFNAGNSPDTYSNASRIRRIFSKIIRRGKPSQTGKPGIGEPDSFRGKPDPNRKES